MNDDTIRFTVSLPKPLYTEMDTEMNEKKYQSRSEYIRDLFRDRQVAQHWATPQAEAMAVLTLMFDHHRKGLYEKIMQIQHDHLVQILCSTHVHIDHSHCLENVILKGNTHIILDIVNQISALKGVEFARLTPCS